MTQDIDKTGLIADAFAMPNLSDADCRVIFLDWAIKLGAEFDVKSAIQTLLAQNSGRVDHPMTKVLHAGLVDAPYPAKRRGGRRARLSS